MRATASVSSSPNPAYLPGLFGAQMFGTVVTCRFLMLLLTCTVPLCLWEAFTSRVLLCDAGRLTGLLWSMFTQSCPSSHFELCVSLELKHVSGPPGVGPCIFIHAPGSVVSRALEPLPLKQSLTFSRPLPLPLSCILGLSHLFFPVL